MKVQPRRSIWLRIGDVDNSPVFVPPAVRADNMGQLGLLALRARGDCRSICPHIRRLPVTSPRPRLLALGRSETHR